MSQDLFEGLEPEQPIRSSVASEAASRAALLLNKLAPLAERMRPKTIDEVIGQKKLLGPGQPLRVAFETHRPHSLLRFQQSSAASKKFVKPLKKHA